MREGHTGFSADPVGVGVRVCIGVGVGVLILVLTISLVPDNGIPPNLSEYIIGTSLIAD